MNHVSWLQSSGISYCVPAIRNLPFGLVWAGGGEEGGVGKDRKVVVHPLVVVVVVVV